MRSEREEGTQVTIGSDLYFSNIQTKTSGINNRNNPNIRHNNKGYVFHTFGYGAYNLLTSANT
jgi:hypothetical protein